LKIPVESSTSYRGRNSRPNWLVLLALIGVAFGIGAIGALVSPGVSTSATVWYAALLKPTWAPPNSWFGPVWTTLYVLMGTSAWLVWGERYHQSRNIALTAYTTQLVLNALWSPSFFGLKSTGTGLFFIIALWLSIAWMIREFARVKPAAAWISIPYLAWVTFAAALNLSIWRLNP